MTKYSICALIFSLLMTAPQALMAESYRYIDESGNIFFVDRLEDVPRQYREQILGKPPTPDPTLVAKQSRKKKTKRSKEKEEKRNKKKRQLKMGEHSAVLPGTPSALFALPTPYGHNDSAPAPQTTEQAPAKPN